MSIQLLEHDYLLNNNTKQLGGLRKKSSRRSSRKSSRKSSSRSRSRSGSRKKKQNVLRSRPAQNPITLKPWSRSKESIKIRQQVSSLPASQPEVKKELFNLLDKTNVILLSGETGSGKTTQVPKLVWEYLEYSDTVICTQPLTTTAGSIAQRVADELDVELGRHVGFRFKDSEKAKGGDISGFPIMVYMTEGTFLNNTIKSPTSVSNYGAVIIDEAHSRGINTDLLLFYIRENLKLIGVKTKFIIMSATLEKEIFLDYFKDFNIQHMHIPGRTFQVQSKSLVNSIYSESKSNFKIFEAIKKTLKLIILDIFRKRDQSKRSSKTKKPEDVLVFLPSKAWITRLKLELESYLEYKKFKNFSVMGLSSDVPIGPERDLRLKPKPGYTKIVLSTNIAETGVTVDGLKYVVDSGLVFRKSFDKVKRVSTMDLTFISQAEAEQRQGRAGRMQEGVCYRLFTNQELKMFEPHRQPEIKRSSIDHELLGFFFQFRNQDNGYQLVREVMDMLVSPPSQEGIDATVKYFRELGLLEDKYEKNRISQLGECYHESRLSFEMTRFFITALGYEIEPEIIADLIAIIEIEPIYGKWLKTGREGLPKDFQSKYTNQYADLIGLYQIYLDFKTDQIPEEFKEYLNLALFDKISAMSEDLAVNEVTGGYCPDLIKPKYSIKKNTYANLVSALRQSFEKTNLVQVKDLGDLKYHKNNLINLGKEKKRTKLIYLSGIDNLIFGQNPFRTYNNFVKL